MIYRDTWAQIDLDLFAHNINVIKKHTGKEIICVVKANAYGHGSVQVAEVLQKLDFVTMFGVATLGEGIELRLQGITKDILVLGATRLEDAKLASNYNISISVFSIEFARELEKIELTKPLKLHIKLDTGMNRIGLKGKNQFEEVLEILSHNSKLMVEGVFTHYGAADELYHTSDEQFNQFKTMLGIK